MKARHFLTTLAYLTIPIVAYATAGHTQQQWLGTWQTRDKWGSDYTIILKQDGTAYAQYAKGINGTWHKKDGGIVILWDNKTRDFLFNGVMGHQRLFTSPRDPASNYNAGMKKQP
ncbi:MAG: hypothetical protein GDA50_08845 [Alphaproteobacteria bacterium GM202ARS2]|nr:hypothetical protein [Alphaproteobacteria bacterium GM202ARS2]